MASIRDYFETDFRHDLAISQERGLATLESGSKITVVERLHLDFNSRAKYISYFIPHSANTFDVCKALVHNSEFAESMADSLRVRSGFVGEAGVDSSDLLFTSRMFLYMADQLTDEQLGSLQRLSSANDLSLVVRGPEIAAERSRLERPRAFICHDSRDKEHIARPLALELARRLCPVWFDEYSLRIGDNLREAIESGIRETEKCIIVVSPNFLSNEGWSKREFDAIYTREIVEKGNVMLPVWHNVGEKEVYEYSPSLVGRFAAKWELGAEEVASQIYLAIETG